MCENVKITYTKIERVLKKRKKGGIIINICKKGWKRKKEKRG